MNWAVGVEPAPLTARLFDSVAPVLGMICQDRANTASFFTQLLHRTGPGGPIETVEDLRTKITYPEVQQLARGSIGPAGLKTLSKILDPAQGFEWPKPEPVLGAKSKQGGNGNCKLTLTLEEQLQVEGVGPLNPATFTFNEALVFDGIPLKGQTATIDAYVSRLFDQMWLAQNQIPQLRTYLRPAAIRASVFDWLAAKLPPLSTRPAEQA